MSRFTRATIDLDALRSNLARVQELAPGCKVMAVIKANGYGHGIGHVARALDGADGFAVATLGEARELRAVGVTGRIVLLEGIHRADDLAFVRALNLELVVHHESQLDALRAARGSATVRVWLKFDTGMNRLGFARDDVDDVREQLEACAVVDPPVRLMSHLACADEPDNEHTKHQIALFEEATAGHDCERSLANSAGILAWPAAHADWVRAGIILYGVSPMLGRTGRDDGLRPAMSLTSELISVHDAKAGDSVGYGARYTCPHDMRLGVVAIGYGDGYPRFTAPGAAVLIDGVECPVVGAVSMDMTTVDVSACPQADVGTQVELWGAQLPIERVAAWAQTIPWVLMCGITRRVDMHYAPGLDVAREPRVRPLKATR